MSEVSYIVYKPMNDDDVSHLAVLSGKVLLYIRDKRQLCFGACICIIRKCSRKLVLFRTITE